MQHCSTQSAETIELPQWKIGFIILQECQKALDTEAGLSLYHFHLPRRSYMTF